MNIFMYYISDTNTHTYVYVPQCLDGGQRVACRSHSLLSFHRVGAGSEPRPSGFAASTFTW